MTETQYDYKTVALRWWLVPVAIFLGVLLPVNAVGIGLVGAFFYRGDKAVASTLLAVAAVFGIVAVLSL